ncbi:unnamed protein product [Ostreobium quekettii]|uniref:Uncharacterized protein n=1 Tax=Ostreobium quekettii TaxID=121088 RepID=A0A8S1J0P0_9CHLO|nr:unnamed protein product [Ostreobium quekettii]
MLLSESCVPLHGPDVVYLQLMSETKSRLQACIPDNTRHNKRWQALITTPHLSVRHFRKSSQWKVLSRSHAELVVADRHVKEMFRRHCYIFNSTQCFVDEHYIPTLISSYGLDNETDCIGRPTYADMYGGQHPRRILPKQVNTTLVKKMQGASESFCDVPRARVSALKLLTGLNTTGCARGPEEAVIADAPQLNQREMEQSDNWVVQRGYRPLSYRCPLFGRKFVPQALKATLRALLSCQGAALGSWC